MFRDNRNLFIALLPLGIVLSSTFPVSAQTVNATNRGAYDASGITNGQPLNYVVGDTPDRGDFHNWFLFTIPTPTPGQVYTSAVLRVNVGNMGGQDSSETVQLQDVTSSLTALQNGTGGTNAYNDLGNGVVYGVRSVATSDAHTLIDISLNSSALSAINAASGGDFALGGSVISLSGGSFDNEFVFGNTNTVPLSETQLILTASNVAAPEPGTLALALPLVAASVGILRRKTM